MRFSSGLAVAFSCLLLSQPAGAASPAGASDDQPARFVPGRILIKPRNGVTENVLANRLLRHGGRQHRPFNRSTIRAVDVNETSVAATLAELQRDSTIEFAERDYLAEAAFVPNDAYVVANGTWHLEKVRAPLAWDITVGADNLIVAVLDSGINAAHPDLGSRIVPGYDFVANDNDPADDFGHGTAVAGVIAASGNNGIGVAGVAFGSKILPVKVLDASGFAAYSAIAQGIRYAVDQGARVINISIAGSAPSSTLQDAINYAWSNNVVIVAAAGNNGNSTPQYPAACEHVVAVSATEPDDSLAGFSSTGNHLTLAAPGDNILTTSRNLNNPYSAWRGTSFASPMVAAVAALVASANPSLNNPQIVSVLEQTADDVGAPGQDAQFGYGRVNAARAVSLASGIPIQNDPPPTPPTVTISQPADNTQLDFGQSLIVSVNAAAGSSNAVITNIQFFANEVGLASVSPASFAITWQPPASGDYSLRAVVTDTSGLNATSAPVVVHVSAAAVPTTASLSLQTSGTGTVLQNFKGHLLTVGQTYTVVARPGLGHVFAGWEGIPSTSPTLTFTMQPGLELVAKFVPSPFNPVKGYYTGLVWNTNGVTPESSGLFVMAVTASGRFSSRMLVGGKRFALFGQLDVNGDATVTFPNRLGPPVVIELHVDLAGGTDQVYGTMNNSHWIATIAGDRGVFNPGSNPAPQAGRHDFLLERIEPSATVATGLGRVTTTGRALVGGTLGDGRRFKAANALAKNGDYPLYLSLSRGSEVVVGWLSFPAGASDTAAGTMAWVKSGANSFAATLQATGAR